MDQWDGSSHQSGGVARVGGYQRSPATAYDYEALAAFDTGSLSGTVERAVLRFHVANRSLQTDDTVHIFAVPDYAWDPANVSYDSLGAALQDGEGWTNPLGSVDVAVSNQWYELESSAVRDLVQSWIDDPSSNQGIVLAANFAYFGYFVEVDGFELRVEVDGIVHELPLPEFANPHFIYGRDSVSVQYMSHGFGHGIRSDGELEFGPFAWHDGDGQSLGVTTLDYGSGFAGDLRSAATIEEVLPGTATVVGAALEGQSLTPVEIERRMLHPGDDDVLIGAGQIVTLAPGRYGELRIGTHGGVVLQSGRYTFRRMIAEDSALVRYDWNQGGAIEIDVDERLQFGSDVAFDFLNPYSPGEINPLAVRYYTNQSSDLEVSSSTRDNFGVFVAPEAPLRLAASSNFIGSLYGREVAVEAWVSVLCPPLLADLSYQRYAMAPPFDPLVGTYHAQVELGWNDAKPWIYARGRSSVDAVTINGTPTDPATHRVNVAAARDGVVVEVRNVDHADVDPRAGYSAYVINWHETEYRDIYVDDDSPCVGWGCAGISPETAFQDLQHGLDVAARTGARIRLMEGTYRPSRPRTELDPRSATFEIPPGTVIEGLGDPLEIVLSGDLLDNDGDDWPLGPDESADNAYHVVTLVGRGSRGISLSNLTVTGGAADGLTAKDKRGGGIFNAGTRPRLQSLVVARNRAQTAGGGVFTQGSVRGSRVALIENLVDAGDGGGWYGQHASMSLKNFGAVGNVAEGPEARGGGIRVVGGTVELTSAVVAENEAEHDGGAISLKGGRAELRNISTHDNRSQRGGGGLVLEDAPDSEIHDSILWRDRGGSELCGNSVCFVEIVGAASVDHSDVYQNVGVYPGAGNFNEDPRFQHADDPLGFDLVPGTTDDGLSLDRGSPCIGAGDATSPDRPEHDIIGWPYASATMDVGAYRFRGDPGLLEAFGRLDADDKFVASEQVVIMERIGDPEDPRFDFLTASNFAKTVQLTVPDHELTRHETLNVRVYAVDGDGHKVLDEAVYLTMYQVEDLGEQLVFQSQTHRPAHPDARGIPVLFTADSDEHGLETEQAVVLHLRSDTGFRFELVR